MNKIYKETLSKKETRYQFYANYLFIYRRRFNSSSVWIKNSKAVNRKGTQGDSTHTGELEEARIEVIFSSAPKFSTRMLDSKYYEIFRSASSFFFIVFTIFHPNRKRLEIDAWNRFE